MGILKILLALLIWDVFKAFLSLAMDGADKDVPKKTFKERIREKMNETEKQ